jgi:hypothetical protein
VLEEKTVKVGLATTAGAVHHEEVRGDSRTDGGEVVDDIVVGVKGVGEGVGDRVPGLSLEVVEARHQGCYFGGESVAVVEKVRAEDVVMLVEATVGRRRRDGEVVLVEGVVSAGKELLEVAEGLEAVFVVEGEGGVLKEVAALVEEVFAEVVLEALPERAGASELAINEEGREETAECGRNVELDGFLDASDPFLVGFGKAPGNAGRAESGVEDPVDSLKVIEAGRAGDIEEETTEEEAFPGSRHHRVHTPNGLGIVFACGPDSVFPRVSLRNVGVLDVAEVGVGGHEREEAGKGSFVGTLLHRCLLLAFEEGDVLFAGEVHCEAIDSGVHAMHVELEAAVRGL